MNETIYQTPFIPLTLNEATVMLRWMIGANFFGLSKSPTEVRLHYGESLTSDQMAAAMSVLQTSAYGLDVVTDKAAILANDTELATITVSGAAMAGDTTVEYKVLYTGIHGAVQYIESEWGSGTAAVTSGTASLTLKTPAVGSYVILVKRQNALHIGRVNVTATPAP